MDFIDDITLKFVFFTTVKIESLCKYNVNTIKQVLNSNVCYEFVKTLRINIFSGMTIILEITNIYCPVFECITRIKQNVNKYIRINSTFTICIYINIMLTIYFRNVWMICFMQRFLCLKNLPYLIFNTYYSKNDIKHNINNKITYCS